MVLEPLRNPLETIIKQAGEILLVYFKNGFKIKEKPDAGLVTDADIASEQFLKTELAKLIPDAAFYAEESGRSGDGDYCWVIDPLDGTNNFAHNLPYFCISVALTYKGVPQIGIIYQPLLKELFYAQKGAGAFLNGQPIRVSAPQELAHAMLLVGLPYVKDAIYQHLLQKLQVIGPRAFAFRHLGSAALDCAYVACGRLDGVFFANLAWWDVAAGVLLIEEAGGKVTDFEGKVVDENYKSFLAGGDPVYHQLKELLKS